MIQPAHSTHLTLPIPIPTPPLSSSSAARAGPLAAAGKNTPEVGKDEYVPAGLTRQQWAEIKAADAAKAAKRKPRKEKVEVRCFASRFRVGSK